MVVKIMPNEAFTLYYILNNKFLLFTEKKFSFSLGMDYFGLFHVVDEVLVINSFSVKRKLQTSLMLLIHFFYVDENISCNVSEYHDFCFIEEAS